MSFFKRKKNQEEPKRDVTYLNGILVNCQKKVTILNQLNMSHQRNVNQILNDLRKNPNNLSSAKMELALWFAKKVNNQKKINALQTIQRKIKTKRDEMLITKNESIFNEEFFTELNEVLGDVGMSLNAEMEDVYSEQITSMAEANLDNSMTINNEVAKMVEDAISSVLSTNEKTDASTTISNVENEKKEDESLNQMLERMKKHF